MRRSVSRESVETATFVAPQIVQPMNIAKVVNTNPIGVRAPSPLRNLSGSRVLVGAKVVGPPISAQSINSTQIIE